MTIKYLYRRWLSSALALMFMLMLAAQTTAADEEWPRRIPTPKGAVTMHQPQLDAFQDNKISARTAVSFLGKGEKEPRFGVVWIDAAADVDRDDRIVTFRDYRITDVKFPEATTAQQETLKELLLAELPKWRLSMSLDQLLTQVELAEKEQKGDRNLNTEPPKIIFVKNPAVLVPLDGDPVLRSINDTPLMRVVNTPFILVYDPAAKAYYLKGGDAWLTAPELQGPWETAKSLSETMQALENKRLQKQPAQGKEVKAGADSLPQIIVSTEPTELIIAKGEPGWTPISGANLLYMSNTDSNVFMDVGAQQYYVLLSGRWFVSKSLDGGWSFVASNQLPADFAKIPPNSAKGFVLANVAGAEQATEAVHDAYIPQTAVIDRNTAATTVTYAGEPKFKSVEGTGMEYAVNTATPVFKSGAKYYAVDQGVWYEADSAQGPWRVSVSPPAERKQIPPSNPHYNAKYVDVYDSTDDVAYVGYTPGYTGSYVQDGTVVYGTGYHYPAYQTDTAYIPPPTTYGYNAAYNPYAGSWSYTPSYYNPMGWFGALAAGAGMLALTDAILDDDNDDWENWWDDGPDINYYGPGRGFRDSWWGPGGYDHYGNINYVHANVIGRRPGQGNLLDNRPWLQPNRPLLREQTAKLKDRRGAAVGDGRLANNLYNRPFNVKRNPAAAAKLRAARESGALAESRDQAGDPLREAKESGALAERRDQTADKLREVKESGALAERREQAADKAKERTSAAKRETRELRRPAKAKGQDNVFADKDGNVVRRDNKGEWRQRSDGKWSKPTRETRPAAPDKPAAVPKPAARPSIDAARLNRESAVRQRGEQRTQQFQRAQAPSFQAPVQRAQAQPFRPPVQRAQAQPFRPPVQRAQAKPQRPSFERAARPGGGFKAGGRPERRGGQGLSTHGGGRRRG